MWINGPGKVFLRFHICKAYPSTTWFMQNCHQLLIILPWKRNFFLNTPPGRLNLIITTNSNNSTIKLPKGPFSPNTKGTCELTGSRWAHDLWSCLAAQGTAFRGHLLHSLLLNSFSHCVAEPFLCPVDTLFPQLMLKQLFSFNFF